MDTEEVQARFRDRFRRRRPRTPGATLGTATGFESGTHPGKLLLFAGRRLLVPVGDPAAREIVWRELAFYSITLQDSDVVLAHLAGEVGEDLVSVFEQDTKGGVG